MTLTRRSLTAASLAALAAPLVPETMAEQSERRTDDDEVMWMYPDHDYRLPPVPERT